MTITVIDYVLVEEKIKERVEMMVVEEKVDSNYYPVIVWLKGKGRSRGVREVRQSLTRKRVWDEEGRKEFRRKEYRGRIVRRNRKSNGEKGKECKRKQS